jgi:RNA polymerase sigma-70 factor (ECF subfamily)
MREPGSEPRLRKFECEALSHLDTLTRAATRIVGLQDAEDTVQETYFRAWKYFDSFETGSNCRAWLFKIMFNVVNDRKKKRARFNEDPLEDSEESAVTGARVLFIDPLKKLEGREVLEAVGRLSEEHRAVIWLVVVEQLSYREVAEVLQVPIGTVMSRLHRARRDLRRQLVRGHAGGATA